MTRLNVNVAVSSSYLMDTFSVIRRLEIVGSNGRGVLSPITFATVTGIVVPEGDNRLNRESDSSRTKQMISVITRFMLRGNSADSSGTYQPDIVQWNGSNYIVEEIEPYVRYGPGFIDAECCMTDFSVNSPTSGVAMLVTQKLQQYPLTQVNSTTFTVAVASNQPFLFRNGVLLVQGDLNGYTIVTTLVASTITLAVPLGLGETLVFYA